MSSKHLIDPELLPGLDLIPPLELSREALPELRAEMEGFLAAEPPPEGNDVQVEERVIQSSEGHELPVLIYTPRNPASSRPVIFHVHGGGYILGSVRQNVASNLRTAAEVDCTIVSVGYRLAPETPHPGPVEDCYTGLKWLHDNAGALGIDLSRLAISGESAGGGLAAGLALLARDRGEFKFTYQHLIYPMIDDRTCIAEPHPYAGEFVWPPKSNHFGWSALIGRAPGGADVSPYAAASRADDLAGLPSTFISVGALDLFVEENLDYARRLMRAGVPTELHVYPGAYHGFDLVADSHIARAAHQQSMAALRRALHPV